MAKTKETANERIKRGMRLWERRVREAVQRASRRGEIWQTRDWYDFTRKGEYWSSHRSAWKAAERLEDRGTITFRRLRNGKGGWVAKGYTLNPGRTKVVKATRRKARR